MGSHKLQKNLPPAFFHCICGNHLVLEKLSAYCRRTHTEITMNKTNIVTDPDLGWKIGDIGRESFTCGTTEWCERCYGVLVKINDGWLTFRPLNFAGNYTWTTHASWIKANPEHYPKHTLEEALSYIAQQAVLMPIREPKRR
jgi:hypothetical protein